MLATFAAKFWLFGLPHEQYRHHTPTAPSASALALPPTGHRLIYSQWAPTTPVGIFGVEAPPLGSKTPSHHYFITVSDWESNAPIISMFVRAGETGRTELPVGKYRITVAEGGEWFGPQKMFGKRMVTKEGVKPVDIFPVGPQGVMGGTIRLTGRIDGNFPTRRVDP